MVSPRDPPANWRAHPWAMERGSSSGAESVEPERRESQPRKLQGEDKLIARGGRRI